MNKIEMFAQLFGVLGSISIRYFLKLIEEVGKLYVTQNEIK